MKPSVEHTVLMQKIAEAVETTLYATFPDDGKVEIRRVTDCDFLVATMLSGERKAVRVSVRKA